MTVLFWALVALVVYVYAGYPLFLALIHRLGGGRQVSHREIEPYVTLIVSAFNEQAVIAEKIENCLLLDYPKEKLQVVIVSDASEDRTDEIVSGFAAQGVELLRMPERGGKTVGLNAAVARARGDIIVFSDANSMYRPDALRALVRNFADPDVGAAVGESGYVEPGLESERTEGLYWRYETAIKRLESAIGSVVGGDGAIYATLKSLYIPMEADALSDFVNPLQVVRSGRRCIYESDARSYERAAGTFEKEFRRKVRIINRGWRALFRMRGLLNPFRYGMFSFALISHKLLRWLVPFYLLGILLLNFLLWDAGVIYQVALGFQVSFYLLAFCGHVLRNEPQMSSWFSIPYYFCLMNAASAMGIVDAFRGKTYTTWTTARA